MDKYLSHFEAKQVYTLVEECCELGQEPAEWQAHLTTSLKGIIGGYAGTFVVTDRAQLGGHVLGSSVNADVSVLGRSIFDAFVQGSRLAHPPGLPDAWAEQPGSVRCASLADASSASALKESSFYRDYLAPLNIHDMLVANAAPCAGIYMNLTVSRGPRESPFGAPERSKLIAIIDAVSSRFEQKLLSHRQRTTCGTDDTVLMVTDMVDFTGLVRRAGDVRARALVRRHNELMRASFARHEGREVAHTGDGFIAAFRKERDAVACGRAIHRCFEELGAMSDGQSLRIRIGIHSGPVLEEEGRLFGAAVIIAVRICSSAGPGQLLISEQVLERLDRQTCDKARPLGATALKGFAEPAVLYEITRHRGATSFAIARNARS